MPLLFVCEQCTGRHARGSAAAQFNDVQCWLRGLNGLSSSWCHDGCGRAAAAYLGSDIGTVVAGIHVVL
jgi:hypothetical protein